MKSDTSSWSWVFNRLMLWGLGTGLLIGFSLVELREVWRHKGPGIVYYDEGDGEMASESKYKRKNYAETGLVLAFGVLIWVLVAKVARDTTAKEKANADYLEAQCTASREYHQAFASAIDEASRKRADAEARSSAKVQEANAAKDRCQRIHTHYLAREIRGE